MKKIMLCMDHNDENNSILEFAVEIARRMPATIIVFNTYFVSIPYGNNSLEATYFELELLEKSEQNYVEKICEKVKTEKYFDGVENIKCESVVNFNLRIPGILEAAEEATVDLIIMGSRCVPSLQKWLGTTSTKVAGKVSIPLLVVPEQVLYSGFKYIVYSTDLKEDPGQALQVIEFARLFNSHVEILHVNETEFDGSEKINMAKFRDKVQSKTDYLDLEFNTITYKDKLSVLIQYVKYKEGNLLVMFKHKYPLFKELFHKSITNSIVFDSEFPVLILHEKNLSW